MSMLDKSRKLEKSALYQRLNHSVLILWEFFRQFGKLSFLEERRLPSPEERSDMEALMGELQAAVERGTEANSYLPSLPKAMRPFFNIIPLLLLYFRSLQTCLAEAKPDMTGETLVRCREQLADCCNMALELGWQWQEREELFQEAALMLDVYQNQLGTSRLSGKEEDGALARFIASSKIKARRDF